jgi:hypothetical protein
MDMNDKQLDQLLQQATKPDLPEGFEARMLQRLQQSADAPSNVIPFPGRKPVAAPQASAPEFPLASAKASPWLIGMPLAASLLIGLSLGLMGYGNQFIETDDLTAAEISTGFEEAELAAEEEPA